MVERSGLLTLAFGRFAWAQPLLRLMYLLAQLIEIFADAGFCPIRIGIDSPAQPVGGSLYSVGQIGLVHAAQGVAQLRRCLRLRWSHLTGRIAHVLFQPGKIVGKLLPILCQLVALLQPGCVLCVAGCVRTASQATNAIRLRMLLLAEAVGFTGERIEPARGLLLLRTTHEACSLAQLVSCLPRRFCTLLLAAATLHRLISLAQPVQCLGYTRVARTSVSIRLSSRPSGPRLGGLPTGR